MADILVLYYSRGGHTAALADEIRQGIIGVAECAARLRTVPPIGTPDSDIPASGPPAPSAMAGSANTKAPRPETKARTVLQPARECADARFEFMDAPPRTKPRRGMTPRPAACNPSDAAPERRCATRARQPPEGCNLPARRAPDRGQG